MAVGDVLRHVVLFLSLLNISLALELDPVRPYEWTGEGRRSFLARRDASNLDFKDYNSFLWEKPGIHLATPTVGWMSTNSEFRWRRSHPGQLHGACTR